MNKMNALTITISNENVVDTAHELYISTANGVEDPNDILKKQSKCVIALDSEYFKRDSTVILNKYKEMLGNAKYSIPTVDDLAHAIFDINLDVFRCMAMVIYDHDDGLMCEAHHNAIVECTRMGFDPDENSDFFSEIYVSEEHEVITSVAADLFNEHAFELSRTIAETIEEVLDSNGCIYSPSKLNASSPYYQLYKLNKENEVIPVVNDCQEILIPELATITEQNPDLRYMRLESGISC